jgi:hypothetical protein
VLEEVEKSWLGPVDVVDNEEKRLRACERFEELAIGPKGLFSGRCAIGIWYVRRSLRQSAKDLLQRPKRDPLAI